MFTSEDERPGNQWGRNFKSFMLFYLKKIDLIHSVNSS